MPWFVSGIYIAAGVVLMAVAVPLMRGRVPRNAWYGVRIPATLRDDDVWYDVNARSGRDLFALGLAVVLLTLATPVLLSGWPAERQALAPTAVLLAGALLLVVRSWRHASRLLREQRRGRPSSGSGVT